jgi:hypothetical protein
VVPNGRVPAGLSAAQQAWALGHHRRFVEVPAGADGFFDAVLQAAGGDFTTADGVFVADTEHLRRLLVEQIDQNAGTDLGLWLAVYTIYADLYRQREHLDPVGGEDARALGEQIDARVDGGQARADIVASIADPGYWPELAEQVAPYFINQLGLAVRVVDPRGVVGRYGRGRPVYLAPLAGDGPRRWVALAPSPARYAVSSPLGAPNRSDPVLVRLGQALDARKTALAATGKPAGEADPVLAWLRGAREHWLAGRTGPQATVTQTPGALRWDPQKLADAVTALGSELGVSSPDGGDVGAGLSLSFAVMLTKELFPPAHGGIRPAQAGEQTSGQAGPPAGIGADQWVEAPSLRDLTGVVPSAGAALFLDGEQAWVALDTTSGLRLVKFAPDQPQMGRVILPTPAEIALMDSPGLALVIAADGHTIDAEQLPAEFASATGWDGDPASTAGRSRQDVPDAVPGISPRQNAWAAEQQAQFITSRPGANSFFEAFLTAAGREPADAAELRRALADHVREMVGSPDGLGNRPLIRAAFIFEARERILEEFLGHDVSRLDQRAVHHQIDQHLDTGAAAGYIEHAIATPGHWEPITELLAPDLMADLAEVNLLVLEPDGRVRGHGDPAHRRLVLARTNPGPASAPGWAAVVPQTREQESEPFADVTIDVASRPAEHIEAGQPAVLNDHQQQAANEEALQIEPTQVGTDSIYSAVLAAAGGGILIDRDTYIDTSAQLRQTLARLVRERPDLLDSATWQQIQQNAEEDLNTEQIIDALIDPAGQDTDQYARHLVGPYLGIELRVIEPDGATHIHGTGRPITIAPTTSQHGHTHWAALVPPTWHEPLHQTQLPGLPQLPAFDQPITTRWNPDHYKLQQPGTSETEDPWRNSTFCVKNEDGVLACVSVSVITINHQPA